MAVAIHAGVPNAVAVDAEELIEKPVAHAQVPLVTTAAVTAQVTHSEANAPVQVAQDLWHYTETPAVTLYPAICPTEAEMGAVAVPAKE